MQKKSLLQKCFHLDVKDYRYVYASKPKTERKITLKERFLGNKTQTIKNNFTNLVFQQSGPTQMF